MNFTIVSGSNDGRPWACNQTPPLSGSKETQLNFYEYKWIRQLLIDINDFIEKNELEYREREDERNNQVPNCIYQCETRYLKKLIDKMTARMKEFEPWISKNTTCHTGYWEV